MNGRNAALLLLPGDPARTIAQKVHESGYLMLSRRLFLAGSGALAAAPLVSAHAAAVLTDDGLYREPWFVDTLLELADDLDDAGNSGRRFAVMWELRGCPYCRETHLVNFARPDIEAYVKERFNILQLNILGDREVTDFDGEKLPEKKLAQKYLIRGPPTFQFFPERGQALAAKSPREREVLRTQGYLMPDDFKKSFRFVAERAYERMSFPDYLRAQS
jgi:thioredoxin-related protein